jgi:hypothetical protein
LNVEHHAEHDRERLVWCTTVVDDWTRVRELRDLLHQAGFRDVHLFGISTGATTKLPRRAWSPSRVSKR